ncbi:MAG TPA: hypothetical protein VM537_26930 [Anaerolineae bacterium]|nr:hypothetical protein [Anaerolineae bacterium]
MPVQACQQDGKRGYRWGESGKCYTYTAGSLRSKAQARLKAEAQGRAAYAAGYKGS